MTFSPDGPISLKHLSVPNTSVGSRTAAVCNVGAAFVAHVARSAVREIDAVIRK